MENKHTFGELYRYPERSAWAAITARPHLDVSQLAATVNSVLADVKAHGDEAVKRYEEQFDHVRLDALDVTADEMAEAELLVDYTLKAALERLVRATPAGTRVCPSRRCDCISPAVRRLSFPPCSCWPSRHASQDVGK